MQAEFKKNEIQQKNKTFKKAKPAQSPINQASSGVSFKSQHKL